MDNFSLGQQAIIKALLKKEPDSKSFFVKLDEENDELSVRENLALGRYGGRDADIAREWLRRKEEARQAVVIARTEDREKESLILAKRAILIAEEANSISAKNLSEARRQARWAMWAAIIAMTAAIVSAKDQILSLVASFG